MNHRRVAKLSVLAMLSARGNGAVFTEDFAEKFSLYHALRRRRAASIFPAIVFILAAMTGVGSATADSSGGGSNMTESETPFVPSGASALRVSHIVLPDGSTQDRYADGSGSGTAPVTYFSPQDVRNGAVTKYLAGESVQQILGPNVGRANPNGSVSGNCGSSFVYLYNRYIKNGGGRGYNYQTGFTDTCVRLSSPAVDFVWHVNVKGPGGFSNSDHDPGHAIYTYNLTLSNSVGTSKAGTYQACVYEPSIAYLSNGGAAASGDPCGSASIT